jgi:hypothetical protein
VLAFVVKTIMTLIVAQTLKDKIRIISDSKKTSPEEILKGTENSVLKAVILHPALCVGFAGSIGRAQVAIEKLDVKRGSSFDVEKVLDHLLHEHLASSQDTDFIVAALSPATMLYEIRKGGIKRNPQNCWIGNFDAFSDYQRYYHTTPSIDRDNVSLEDNEALDAIYKMHMAFMSVIRSRAYQDVGEFTIEVATEPDGFKYMESAIAYPVTQSIPSHTWTTVRFGSTAEGGYCYSIMTPLESGIGAIGIHFFQGNFGALFYPAKSATRILYRDVTAEEFKVRVSHEFGFGIEGPRIS